MTNIVPISDLKNYTEVLSHCDNGSTVYLTKNGRGKYVVQSLAEHEKLQATVKLLAELAKGVESIRTERRLSMAKVTLSKEAQRDIIAIRNYIRDELCNPSAAKHIIACLKKSIQSLEKFSGRGRPLDALLSVHTEYRYLVCENYCIFYLEDNEPVIIVRILHQRQDSLRALFLEK